MQEKKILLLMCDNLSGILKYIFITKICIYFSSLNVSDFFIKDRVSFPRSSSSVHLSSADILLSIFVFLCVVHDLDSCGC